MTNKSRQQNEEVDLGQLFVMIGNTINRFFQFIASIFKNLFFGFVWVVFFVKKHTVVFSIAAVTGLISGFVMEETSDPIYKSTITVRQNYQTGENLYGSIDYYNGLLKDRDYKILGDVLGLSEESSEQVVSFDIEPVITNNDLLIMFNDYVEDLDSLALSKVEYDEYVNNINEYRHPFQQISIKSKTRANFNSVFNNIVGNILTNEFFVNEQKKDILELTQTKQALVKALKQSDSLQETYKKVMQMDSNRLSDVGITFEGNNENEKTREFDLFMNDIDLREDIVTVERKLKDKENIIDLISSKQDSGFVDHTKDFLGLALPINVFYPVLILSLVFLVMLAREFLKYLEKYKPTI
jgi:hypothetical protein